MVSDKHENWKVYRITQRLHVTHWSMSSSKRILWSLTSDSKRFILGEKDLYCIDTTVGLLLSSILIIDIRILISPPHTCYKYWVSIKIDTQNQFPFLLHRSFTFYTRRTGHGDLGVRIKYIEWNGYESEGPTVSTRAICSGRPLNKDDWMPPTVTHLIGEFQFFLLENSEIAPTQSVIILLSANRLIENLDNKKLLKNQDYWTCV